MSSPPRAIFGKEAAPAHLRQAIPVASQLLPSSSTYLQQQVSSITFALMSTSLLDPQVCSPKRIGWCINNCWRRGMGCCYREIHVKFLYIYGNCNALHYVLIIVIMERDVQLCFLNCSQSVHEIFMVYFKFSNSIRRCSMMYFFYCCRSVSEIFLVYFKMFIWYFFF